MFHPKKRNSNKRNTAGTYINITQGDLVISQTVCVYTVIYSGQCTAENPKQIVLPI